MACPASLETLFMYSLSSTGARGGVGIPTYGVGAGGFPGYGVGAGAGLGGIFPHELLVPLLGS